MACSSSSSFLSLVCRWVQSVSQSKDLMKKINRKLAGWLTLIATLTNTITLESKQFASSYLFTFSDTFPSSSFASIISMYLFTRFSHMIFVLNINLVLDCVLLSVSSYTFYALPRRAAVDYLQLIGWTLYKWLRCVVLRCLAWLGFPTWAGFLISFGWFRGFFNWK